MPPSPGKLLQEFDTLRHHVLNENGVTMDLDYRKAQEAYPVIRREAENACNLLHYSDATPVLAGDQPQAWAEP